MATIKSFTSLEQSRKLAKILPLESADMLIGNYVGKSGIVDGTNIHYYTKGEILSAPQIIEAWSLAALLEQLPCEICDDKGNSANISIYKEKDKYKLVYNSSFYEDFDAIETDFHENLVDACVAMIESLHELNLL